MKNLIRKILKENDFEWVEGLDVNAAEKEVKGPFDQMRMYQSVDGDRLYDLLIQYGVRQPIELKEIGEWLYNEFEAVYENGTESCECDGCCDDMIYYEDHHHEMESAKEDAYDRGFSDGKSESESEIEELKNQISDLESRLNEGQNKKNIKRI